MTRPYDAPAGTVWEYDPNDMPEGSDGADDEASVFLLLDGYDDVNDLNKRNGPYRRAYCLLNGTHELFAYDSRMNFNSKQIG